MSDVAKLAAGLSPELRRAVIPLAFFTDKQGAELKRLGLLDQHDGAWVHTKLGMDVANTIAPWPKRSRRENPHDQ